MIIFFHKKTGQITGTVDGRIHPEEHLNMCIGDHTITEKLVVNWKKKTDNSEEFEPDHPQKDIFLELDKNPSTVYDYTVDIQTRKLIKKVV